MRLGWLAIFALAIPAWAESTQPNQLDLAAKTLNATTGGDAFVADSPAGPLGLRFSGGVVIDSQSSFGSHDGETGLDALQRGHPYLGIGVVQHLGRDRRLDLSADLGLIQRETQTQCLDDSACMSQKTTIQRNNETVISLGLRYRF
ncbi:hypothetical protein [Litorivicinus lipolyticus]|jgi:hypothetical protein|uniref:hypothetical protein n=1 Tax=Litorivicinus lipolyticus TaxID=418701 RepID=UPI003B5AD660